MTLTTAEPADLRMFSLKACVASRRHAVTLLLGLWLVIFFAALFTPPVLDDADGTHSNAARQMMLSGDLVTLRVNNVRYLEKAPLPYWIAAASMRVFGINAFAVHLPQSIAVLLLALLAFHWAGEAYGPRAALYAGFGVLTSAGVFLFTRVFIPDVLLSLLLALSLYCLLKALEPAAPAKFAYAMWAALAFAVLTKGLVAIVFFAGAALPYLALADELRSWRRVRIGSGLLLFLVIAAPWHILAGLRNIDGMNGHGFFWFYFVNEHILRFLGRRIPRDYNKLPGYLYWTLHLVWLFPWSLFIPVAVATAWRDRTWRRLDDLRESLSSMASRTTLLLTIFSALVLIFFSISTNQEYYTFPVYLPVLILLVSPLARAEARVESTNPMHMEQAHVTRRWLTFAHASLAILGALIAIALAWGLWLARSLPSQPNVGDLLAHRGVGDYTLSMSSLFDLTGPSFAALRLPATLALAAFAIGPAAAWMFRSRRIRSSDPHLAATLTIALTSTIFLIAAHLAFARFAPMLSSQDFAATVQRLESSHSIAPNSTFLLYGDQAYGSSLPFYLDHPLSQPVQLVEGRSSSMLFGSYFADSTDLFLTSQQLVARWGTGPRKVLFVPLEYRDEIDRLIGARQFVLAETAGKALITDRPLDTSPHLP